MTAANLLDRLTAADCRPVVECEELILEADPPAEVAAALVVLHTGVRALLTGKQWYGLAGGNEPHTGRIFALDPRLRIPHGVGLLCVEGDIGVGWDRLDRNAFLDLSDLFDR